MLAANELTIDTEFATVCPPLSEAERGALEQSILAEGCRDPLVAWNGVLVDGHNRYAICSKHGVGFSVVEMQFESRDAVKAWMLANQLGRRNLSFVQASYMRGCYYRLRRKPNGGCRKKTGEPPYNTAHEVAERFQVSPSTIRHDCQLANAIDKLCDNAKLLVLDRETTLRKQSVIDLAQLEYVVQERIVEKLRKKELPELRSAIMRLRPPAEKNTHSVRCKRCGVRLAPGVVTCLKCDIDTRQALKDLEGPRKKRASVSSIDDMPDGWQERLAEMQHSKKSGDDLRFYAQWIEQFIDDNLDDITPKSHPAQVLSRLTKKLLTCVGSTLHDRTA